ncbi:MAG: glutamine-hydrolyzing GMP synthase [Dehalococcoidia bacterium]|jgi:GMP synthase (glutamine-hydrolysing)|nr:glutamine-hydrolyzing GMP synthase [Dehalococcoidia bacterium]HIN15265.1 glutamine-hydrolyzing GMP synthase [Dehalococcoidia bacterium]|tara:strand:+ start:8779 stop:10446 length:1668 start_codon:yes stop_codon:yes gene_type:complete
MTGQPTDGTSRRVSTSDDIEVGTYLEIAQADRTTGVNPPVDIKTKAIIIIDFGAQYSRLIARRVRESNTYCEIIPYDAGSEILNEQDVIGVILSGGPNSVYEDDAPMAPAWVFDAGVPILGICYGMQLIAHQLGGKVESVTQREYGHTVIHKDGQDNVLFEGLDSEIPVWMSHGDRIEELPPGFRSLAYSENSPIAVMGNEEGTYFGIQFHPEVVHTPQGSEILRNFVFGVCHGAGDWTPVNFVSDAVDQIREQVGDGKVICALSGGVDSTVVAALIQRAIGDRLTCIFVDNGLMRRGEADRVQNVFASQLGVNLIFVDGTERFLAALKGVTDPEVKRKAIGEEFIKVFEEVANDIGEVDYLAQGTLYPDVIESISADSSASHTIKTHHNVGGLPERMNLKLVEPLRYMFKDEVRKAGIELGLTSQSVNRQPFPGPGLAIRIMGEVTYEKLEILRAVDWIVIDEVKADGLYERLWQSFAVLTNTRTVGVMGDQRTYQYVVAIRAVTSDDAMTADWARLPYDTLARISNRIVNEVPEVNRVVLDITSKPPGTIEWE